MIEVNHLNAAPLYLFLSMNEYLSRTHIIWLIPGDKYYTLEIIFNIYTKHTLQLVAYVQATNCTMANLVYTSKIF